MLDTLFSFFKNPAIIEVTWKNIVEPGRPQMTILCMRIACRIPNATNTHSQYVILTASPLSQCYSVTLYVQCLSCFLSSGRSDSALPLQGDDC